MFQLRLNNLQLMNVGLVFSFVFKIVMTHSKGATIQKFLAKLQKEKGQLLEPSIG